MINQLHSLTFSSHFVRSSLLSFSSLEKILRRFRAYSCNFYLLFLISFSIFLSLFFVLFKVFFSSLFVHSLFWFKIFFSSRFFVLLFIIYIDKKYFKYSLLKLAYNHCSFKKLRTKYFQANQELFKIFTGYFPKNIFFLGFLLKMAYLTNSVPGNP